MYTHSVLLLFFVLSAFSLNGLEIAVQSPEGEVFFVDIDENTPFSQALSDIQLSLGTDETPSLTFLSTKPLFETKASAGVFRNYQASVSTKERKDIGYIINTLGFSSLVQINKNKSALNQAGKRIDHVHPLRFLMTVFTDEHMKASIHAMQNRGWVWGEFSGGIKDSLENEANSGNMRDEFIQDFAAQVNIDQALIAPLIQAHDWNQLIKILIDKIPRNGNPGRYDM